MSKAQHWPHGVAGIIEGMSMSMSIEGRQGVLAQGQGQVPGIWKDRVPQSDPRLRNVEIVTWDEYIKTARQCVIYVVNGKERRSPWFNSQARAERALEILRTRHGNGILFVD